MHLNCILLAFCINLMNLNLVLVNILCHITKIVVNISLEFGWFFKPCPKYWPTYSCLTNSLFFKLFVTVFIKVCSNIWIAYKLLQIVLQPMLHILLLSVEQQLVPENSQFVLKER